MHAVLGNLVRTYNIEVAYIDKDDSLFSILAVEVFVIHTIKNRLNVYSPGQWVFVHDRFLPIKHA